jgi:hypothetical protein
MYEETYLKLHIVFLYNRKLLLYLVHHNLRELQRIVNMDLH